MPPPVPEPLSRTQLNRVIDTLYRSESGRVLAMLVRRLGDLDLAEGATHEAFATTLESWPQTGIPDQSFIAFGEPEAMHTQDRIAFAQSCRLGRTRPLPARQPI